jgi:hypothetical protein
MNALNEEETMNNIYIRIFVILILIFLPANSFAGCPDPNTVTTIPKLTDVEVHSSVVLDPKTGIYSFSYWLKNGSESTGCIWSFEVDITKPAGGITLSKEGLVNYVPVMNAPKADSPPIIPVAFPSVPMRGEHPIWDGDISVYGTASWGSDRYTYEIAPGDTLGGFVMTSYGLPAIRDFKIKPKYIAEDEDVYNMGVSETEYIKNPSKYLKAFYDSISWKGKTIGVTAPPANLNLAAFLDYIIDLKHQAASLGWIDNTGIVNSLDVKLDNAKKKLSQGDNNTAKNILGAFLNEVEAQTGKHLTSDAYALLKYNALYLIDNLK